METTMTLNDLKEFVRKHFPNGELTHDNDGQLVIYTGLTDENCNSNNDELHTV